MTVTDNPFTDDKWFVWAATPTDARRQVATHTGIPQTLLKVGRAGLTRPGSYDYSGFVQQDNVKEIIGTTTYRYTVTA